MKQTAADPAITLYRMVNIKAQVFSGRPRREDSIRFRLSSFTSHPHTNAYLPGLLSNGHQHDIHDAYSPY